MESGGGGGDGSANCQLCDNFPTIFQQGGLPLTAVNKFLWSHQRQLSSQQSNQTFFPQRGGFYDFSSYNNGGANGSAFHANGISWSSFPEPGLADSIFFTEQSDIWNNPQEILISSQKNLKESGKKAKEAASNTTVLVKGPWTDEEDRKLVKLVNRFGVKKWVQIAENMFGRAGKQCRERWHNHLRPDIKKEAWSEEEELMLVEEHKQIGNKWAEIAKRIPGRTENAIKNHWNATKRRQNSRRNKLKKQEKDGQSLDSKYRRSNILQDYIRSKYFSHDDNSPLTLTLTPTHSTSNTIYNLTPPYSDDESPLLTPQTYDEEINFMQNLFGQNSLVENNGNADQMEATKTSQNMIDNISLSRSSYAFNGFGHDSTNYQCPKETQLQSFNAHSSSDLYLPYLLDFNSANGYIGGSFGYGNMVMNHQGSSSAGGGNKDVDLLEMVSSSNKTFF